MVSNEQSRAEKTAVKSSVFTTINAPQTIRAPSFAACRLLSRLSRCLLAPSQGSR
jgi:hypothetical protein